MAAAGCGGGGGSPAVPKDIAPAPTPATGAAPWPAPPNPLELARKAGLVPETHEFFQYHVHAHLDVYVNGTPEPVPAGLGIETTDPGVHHQVLEDGSDVWGFISEPCAQPCISPLHTHDVSGILHTESKHARPNTLGQLFTEWDVRLDRTCVGGYCEPAASILVYVDGDRSTGSPAAITLTNHKEIAIVVGTPPASIPTSYHF